jgi:hypothetical protein
MKSVGYSSSFVYNNGDVQSSITTTRNRKKKTIKYAQPKGSKMGNLVYKGKRSRAHLKRWRELQKQMLEEYNAALSV